MESIILLSWAYVLYAKMQKQHFVTYLGSCAEVGVKKNSWASFKYTHSGWQPEIFRAGEVS